MAALKTATTLKHRKCTTRFNVDLSAFGPLNYMKPGLVLVILSGDR
jgi:hypothetical protein